MKIVEQPLHAFNSNGLGGFIVQSEYTVHISVCIQPDTSCKGCSLLFLKSCFTFACVHCLFVEGSQPHFKW